MERRHPATRTQTGGPAGWRRLPRALRWLGLVVLGLGLARLVAFHAQLLWQRLADLSIGRPEVALRWLGAALVLAGLAALARQGSSLVADRRALAFWVLALLLHVGASPVPNAAVTPDAALLVLPLGVAAAALLEAAAAWLAGRSASGASHRRAAGWRAAQALAAPPATGLFDLARFSPRPPPAIAH